MKQPACWARPQTRRAEADGAPGREDPDATTRLSRIAGGANLLIPFPSSHIIITRNTALTEKKRKLPDSPLVPGQIATMAIYHDPRIIT
jgi:hypothetical protein